MGNTLHKTTPKLQDLATTGIHPLRVLYEQQIGRPPPKNASRAFILGNLSWAMQTRKSQKNLGLMREKLLKQSHPEKSKEYERYQPGMRLVREWHGVTYEVTVAETGYRYQGESYRSLTAIAQHITGAGWSGPRFFGLRPKT
jgi:hypothetical protein